MEPVDKKRALEVNKMCATSEDLLITTIRKRKHYPQKIKECLQKRQDADLNNLVSVRSLQCDLEGISVWISLLSPGCVSYLHLICFLCSATLTKGTWLKTEFKQTILENLLLLTKNNQI